jgi:uncharacterized protein involved in outer membrane biogenesis
MKKKLLIVIASLATVLAATVLIVVYKLNDLVQGFRPQIEQQLSVTLGSKVELGEISASLFPTCHLSVHEVKVLAPDGRSTSMSLGSLTASVALRPLLSKKLDISNLEIQRPRITLIKDASGTSIQGLNTRPSSTQPAQPSQSSERSGQPSSSPTQLDIAVSRVSVTDGELTIDDRVASKRTSVKDIDLTAGVEIQGKQINVPSLKLSFAPSPLPQLNFTGARISYAQESGKLSIGSIDASSDVGGIHAEGTLDTKTQSGVLSVSSKGIDLRKAAGLLKSAVPTLASMNITGTIATSLAVTLAGGQPSLKGPVTLKEINLDLPGPQKVRSLSGDINLQGSLTDLSVSTSTIKLSFQDAPLRVATTARVTSANVTVQALNVSGLGGETRLPATIQLNPPKAFSAQPSISSVSIEELLKVTKPDLSRSITGTIVSAKGNFSGSTMGEVARSVNGAGDLLIKNAVLKGVNVPNLILSKVSNIPLLEGTLRSNIAPEHQKYFNDPDTKVAEFTSEYSLGGGVINLKSLRATSEAFVLQSSGTMSMDGELNLASNFILSADISTSLAKRSKTVENMLTKDKRLEIPVVIKGKSPALVVLPDISKLLQGAGGRALEQQAGKLLEKALGGKKGENKQKNPLGGLFGIK